MKQINKLINDWTTNTSTIDKGILVGTDITLEWTLPWWWQHYSKFNTYPVTFIDFGMSEKAKEWCKEKGQLIVFEISMDFITPKEKMPAELIAKWETLFRTKEFWDVRTKWFKKPISMLLSPYNHTIWIDLDCEIKRDLEPLFETFQKGMEVAVVPEPHASLMHFEVMGLISPGQKLFNCGVLLFEHGSYIMARWAQKILQDNSKFAGDSDLFSSLISSEMLEIFELPEIYNWRIGGLGPNPNSVIDHWVGEWGKQEIRKEIQKLT